MKKKYLSLLLTFITFIVLGQNCIEGNCVNGYGVIEYNNGTKYYGEFKNSKFNGLGVLTFESYVFNGFWQDGIMNGKGFTSNENCNYFGELINSIPTGEGQFKYNDGSIAISKKWMKINNSGYPERHSIYGIGEITYSENVYYIGEIIDGVPNGKGTYFNNGEIKFGIYKDGELFGGYNEATRETYELVDSKGYKYFCTTSKNEYCYYLTDVNDKVWMKQRLASKQFKNAKTGKVQIIKGGEILNLFVFDCNRKTFDIHMTVKYDNKGNVISSDDLGELGLEIIPGTIIESLYKIICN